jgi:hypothetical protein
MATSNTMYEETQIAHPLGEVEKGLERNSSRSRNSESHEISTEIELDVLEGYKAFMLVFSISLAGFLYSLDVNIIVTVS